MTTRTPSTRTAPGTSRHDPQPGPPLLVATLAFAVLTVAATFALVTPALRPLPARSRRDGSGR